MFDDDVEQWSAVDREAAMWATRSHGGLDAAAAAEFAAWLNADPAHGRAYAGMERSLERVRALPEEAVRTLRAGLADAAARPHAQAVPAGLSAAGRRRPWTGAFGGLARQLAAAAAVLVVAGGAWLGWGQWFDPPVFTASYTTGRGQQRDVELPDGSVLQLDTTTHVEVRLYRQRREVRLADGQVMFTVQGDRDRPFAVLAGASRITVVGTRFSVRHTQVGLAAGKTVVSVESGDVRVAGRNIMPVGGASVALGAGQGVTVDDGGRLAEVVSLPAAGVGAWRSDRVSFDDTPLAEALAEFERYGRTGLVVRDPEVAALRLGGSFDLRQTAAFARTLPLLLPVRLERRGEMVEIVGVD
ncbi:DUF4880 domain-containing protein [Pseudothauera rhizosphaerae]|uniref:DUF4880 domain-containing protein n=2 Tax=Pseudothauera rhizosphaerae TaxID=2565932 RepID=A0A4S4AKC4_9RHOO|nr:DUF4880 domain-containing protein [Pseudothauera rhizosphaerae]